ncbi:MAG: hypothetical protein JSU96_18305 [Acidobacteriota bacterium]|nr:MAG: hypothetical protein JSU96_18305 [Acidobacteriota bacterium]
MSGTSIANLRSGAFRGLIHSCLFTGLALTCLYSSACINKKTVLKAGSGEVSAGELEREGEQIFAQMPRTVDSARTAYELMVSAARVSRSEDPERFFRLHRAAWFGIWATHHGSGDWKSSLARELIVLCNTAVEEHPERVEGYYFRAISIGLFAQENKLYGRDAMQEFRADAQKAIEIDPRYDFGGPHRVLGALYLRAPGPPAGIGSTQRAYRQLLIAHEISPDYPENLLFLGEVCLRLNRPEESRSYLAPLQEAIPRYGDEADRDDWRRRRQALEQALAK